jgi:hypothetical protein
MNSSHQDPVEGHVATPSKRARLASLLFDGAKLGTTLPASALLEPKLPRLSGE